MIILGLTGGIACGKSNVSDALKELGAAVVDGDLLARQLTVPGGAALAPIRKAFGGGVFLPDGQLDRRALGAVVFSSRDKLAVLNGIMEPLLMKLICERIDRARQFGRKVCVLDMPLLYEKGLDSLCDKVWCVYLPPEEQLKRLMVRDGLPREAALARMRSQMDPAEKAARANTVIDTSGSIEQTRAKIPPLYRTLLVQGGQG